jgi:hypothetical protein
LAFTGLVRFSSSFLILHVLCAFQMCLPGSLITELLFACRAVKSGCCGLHRLLIFIIPCHTWFCGSRWCSWSRRSRNQCEVGSTEW